VKVVSKSEVKVVTVLREEIRAVTSAAVRLVVRLLVDAVMDFADVWNWKAMLATLFLIKV